MNVSISVIIPTLNEEQYLPQLLQDLSEQTSKPTEVIIVDAHSEDRTCVKAEEYHDVLDVRVVQSDKRHLAYQRNIGAREARGDFLLFLDADMHLEAHFIEQLIHHIKKTHYLIYLPIHVPHDGEYQDELLYRVAAALTEVSHQTHKPFTYGPGAVFHRQYFYYLGGYDEEVFVYEDHEIVQRARKRGVKAKLLPESPVYFSFRRFRSEGRINVVRKYLVATLHLLAKGKVDEQIFTYEMGGSATYLLAKKEYFDLNKTVLAYFDKLKKLLEE